MARFVGVSSIPFSTGTGGDPQKMQRAMEQWEGYIDTEINHYAAFPLWHGLLPG